ncbi:MAG: Ig-like domain-containing protein [Rikenellaceae bacterium]
MQINRYRTTICAALLLLLIVGCATISSPQGGPKDSLPPYVTYFRPEPYTTNFTGKKVEFTFNEYVVLKDQSKLFFVSPEMEKKPTLSIRGKKVIAEFEDTLKQNQTYRLDLGAAVADNNEGNKMDYLAFTFSTGDYIDSIMMVGQVLDARTQDTIVGAFVTFYDPMQDSTLLDSTLYKSRAQVMARSDSSGYFVTDILKPMEYRLYAFLDKNGNQRYEEEADLVYFTDGVTDPLQQNGFSFGYDSVLKRMYIDSLQVTLELFQEKKIKRQMLLDKSRPQRQELFFEFNAPNGGYDSIVIDSIPNEWLIEDYNTTRDTLRLWIAPPTKDLVDSLRDTIKLSGVFAKQDSAMQHYWERSDLVFTHKIKVEKTEEEREAEERQKKEEARQERREGREARSEERGGRGGGRGGRGEEGEEGGEGGEGGQRPEGGEQRPPRPDSTMMDSLSTQRPPMLDSTMMDSLSTQRSPMLDSLMMPMDSLAMDSLAMDSLAMDSLPPKPVKNPFAHKVTAASEFNPSHNIVITFDLPLRKVDSSLIVLTQITEIKQRGARKGEKEVAATEEREIIDAQITQIGLRRIEIAAPFLDATKYELSLDSATFENIAFQINDSTGVSFTTMDPEKYGTLIFNINDLPEGDTTDHSYILELYTPGKKTTRGDSDESDHKVIRTIKDVKADSSVTVRFLKPEKYLLRIIEDTDGNGEWTTGKLADRQRAERVRVYRRERNARPHFFEATEKYDIAEEIFLNELFLDNE